MKKIIFVAPESDLVNFEDIDERAPIFAKKNGVLKGMVVHHEHDGWIVNVGAGSGSSGYSKTLKECIQGASHHYDFFIE